MRKWFQKFWRNLNQETPKCKARVTESSVEVLRDGEIVKSIDKEDIISVQIQTTDEGPWLDDIFFCLQTSEADGLVISNDMPGGKDVADFVLELDGLDEPSFIEAMGSTSNRIFEIWKK